MTNARRLLSVGAFLGLVGVVTFIHGQPSRPALGQLSTPAQERAYDKTQDDSPFAKGGVFTYLPGKGEQLFAVALKPKLPESAVKGRDFLIMLSLSATQAGEGWQASTRIADMLVKNMGENDRVSLWTIGTPDITKSILKETDGFLSPKNAEHLKKIDAACEKIKVTYPSGDTDLRGGIAKAIKTFDGNENRQRILVFLGDGQSTHDPMDADARFALTQEMVNRKIGFFPVPLGLRIHPENLHGLATGTGGLVLRTRVGAELLGPVIERYMKAFQTPILYDVAMTLPEDVKVAYPTKLPPLRSDASTLIVGSMTPSDAMKFEQVGNDVFAGDFTIKLTGTMVGKADPVALQVTEKTQAPVIDHFFLTGLVSQWQNAKDRPALLPADRTLGIAYEQTRLHRDELLITAQLAVRDLKLEEAARAFQAAKILAPHDAAPDAGLKIVDRVKKGQLPPDAMKRMLEKRDGVQVAKGLKPQAVTIQLAKFAQDEKDPKNAPVVPPPGAQDRDDLLQQHRDQAIIQEQKWTEIVETTLRQGRRELQQDPDGTMDALRTILSRVRDNPALSERVRNGLAQRLEVALTEAKSQATILKVHKEEVNRNVAVAKGLFEKQMQSRTLQDRQEEQLRAFRSLVEIAYFDEKTKKDVLANLLALQTENRLRGQNWPVAAQADYEMVLAGYNLEKSNELRRQREDRFLATMVALDKSFIPFPDEPGIEFPKLATWKQMTKYRKDKYEVSDIPDDPKGRELANSILKLLEEEVEIPEEFRRADVAFPDFLKFFTDKMSFRGQDLPIWIDKGAFKEEAPDAEDIMDTQVRFPPYIRKMPIATALRIALSQVKGVPATYLIRRNVIEITTEYRFTVDKVIRVHPVADLTIPVSQLGATQQFGTAGTQIGFGGQFGQVGQIGQIGQFGQFGQIGQFQGGIGGIGGFVPGTTLGGTAGSFNGGAFTGGFNGSLGAVGGTTGMQELIKLITIVVDPGHWYYVQQASPFQQGINNAFNNRGGVGGGFNGGGALGGGALGGALGGAGGGAPAAGPAPTPPAEGGPASLTNPTTNTIYPYMPTLALIIRAQARTHTSLTGGFTNRAAKAAPGEMPINAANQGKVPFQQAAADNAKAKAAAVAAANDAKNPKNKVQELVAKHEGNVKAGKALDLTIDPEVWDGVLAEGSIPPEMIIATAEALFEQPNKKHAAEFLKSNLRRGILVRPWVFEALAIALEASGGDPAEARRARLSAVALDPKDAEGFLEAARGMAETGQFDRALAFCRQAALIEPNLVFSYDQALAYAEQTKDVKAMEWAASRVVAQDWPLDNHNLHLNAQTRVHSLAQALDRESRKSDADKLRAALHSLKQRDLVVNVTWETNQELADLELFVKEPTGSVCSFEQKQTTGGGTLIANDVKTPNKITYVAAQGFNGTYEIRLRKLFGRPLFGQARVEIIQNLGTPKEVRRLEMVKLDDARPISIRVDNGRRTELAIVSPANAKKPAPKNDAQVSGYEHLRRLAYPDTTRAVARTQTPAPATRPNLPAPTPTAPTLGVRTGESGASGPSQGNTHPVYQSLRNAATLAAVPGGR